MRPVSLILAALALLLLGLGVWDLANPRDSYEQCLSGAPTRDGYECFDSVTVKGEKPVRQRLGNAFTLWIFGGMLAGAAFILEKGKANS